MAKSRRRSSAIQRRTARYPTFDGQGNSMRGYLVALALAIPCAFGTAPAAAQSDDGSEQAAAEPLTAEKIIEVARERLRPPGVWRPCPLPENPNEIVVCARDPDELRVESPTDEAIRKGEAVDDGIPRAPDMSPPCTGVCMRVGPTPYRPIIVDLTDQPGGLSEEEAALVYRVEDGPPREAPPVPEEEVSP